MEKGEGQAGNRLALSFFLFVWPCACLLAGGAMSGECGVRSGEWAGRGLPPAAGFGSKEELFGHGLCPGFGWMVNECDYSVSPLSY